ncbi:hypothetical protein FOL47_006640 [Perkinsus chesapeaki]|uniref:subtilisin n=1 Tax=Perkinsus chesapeaki TaxID=330153 RepID=A0A7J6LQE6_PERCH|nr:hypothetical protein FOL47_006640 [Perkinsus chesapeaki]
MTISPDLPRLVLVTCLLWHFKVSGLHWKKGNVESIHQLTYPPNDPLFHRQIKLFEVLHINETWTEVRESELPRRDVIVTAVDTGVATQQPDLDGKLLKGKDASGAWRSSVEDVYDHGTGIAGIIAAGINNGIGIAGIADRVKIRPIRVVAHKENGVSAVQVERAWDMANGFKDSDVIVFAGGDAFTKDLSLMYKRVITKAVGQGSFVVIAADNSNDSGGPDEIILPCSMAHTIPGVVCVTATKTSEPTVLLTDASLLATFGVPATEVEIMTAERRGEAWMYSTAEGSSCATAIVGGIAALMQSFKKFKPDVIKEILLNATEGKVKTAKGVEMLWQDRPMCKRPLVYLLNAC